MRGRNKGHMFVSEDVSGLRVAIRNCEDGFMSLTREDIHT
jgi:hypothetical protein